MTSLKQLDPLRNSGFLKQNLDRKLRLLAKDISEFIEPEVRFEKPVILFLRMYKKGRNSSNYSNLYEPNTSRTERERAKNRLNKLVTEDLLNRIRRRLENYKKKSENKLALPDEYLTWVQQTPEWSTSEGDLGITIYESQDWVDNLDSDFYYTFFKIIQGVVFDTFDDLVIKRLEGDNYFASRDDCTVIYSQINDPHRSRKILYLITSFNTAQQVEEKYQREKERLAEEKNEEALLIKLGQKDATVDKIMRNSCRAYPADIIVDHERWLEIEKDEDANLALSWEEEELLAEIMNPESDKNLPVFINGRAGSGKSTMLLYLLAVYLNRVLDNDSLPGDVLYLTYNKQLLKKAEETERKILTSHYALEWKRDKDDEMDEKDKEKLIKSGSLINVVKNNLCCNRSLLENNYNRLR
ncbi:hypothetical protein MWH30_12635, partial [Fuchsiella alkaliacetigena]|nr:hypothetical protein [Fuchsiella alkaliacetigena]